MAIGITSFDPIRHIESIPLFITAALQFCRDQKGLKLYAFVMLCNHFYLRLFKLMSYLFDNSFQNSVSLQYAFPNSLRVWERATREKRGAVGKRRKGERSEEHTSELQSQS